MMPELDAIEKTLNDTSALLNDLASSLELAVKIMKEKHVVDDIDDLGSFWDMELTEEQRQQIEAPLK